MPKDEDRAEFWHPPLWFSSLQGVPGWAHLFLMQLWLRLCLCVFACNKARENSFCFWIKPRVNIQDIPGRFTYECFQECCSQNCWSFPCCSPKMRPCLRCWQQSKRCLVWLSCYQAEVDSAYKYAAEVGRAQVHVVTSWAGLKLSGWALLSNSLGERCEQQQCLCWSCSFHQQAPGCFAVSSLASVQVVPDPQSFCGRL